MSVSAETLINDANNRVTELVDIANNFVERLASEANRNFSVNLRDFPTLNFSQPTEMLSAIQSRPERPTDLELNEGKITDPGNAPDVNIDPVDTIQIPEESLNLPNLDIPVRPSTETFNIPTSPGVADIPIPSSPTLSYPVVPTLADVDLPTAPNVVVPTFDSVSPDDNLLQQTNNFTFDETLYDYDLLLLIKQTLNDDLVNGGFGLHPDDDQRLFEDARDRSQQSTLSILDEISRVAAARGFELPPGSFFAKTQEAQQKVLTEMNDLNREITFKRADLFVQARQFAMAKGIDLEQVLINYFGEIAERELNASKAIAELGIAIFNASVNAFQARLSKYQADAQVYESRIRALLAQTDIFKSEVEAARLKSEVNKDLIDIYVAQLRAVDSIVGVFRTEMEAANVRAQIERTKLEGFRSEVDAFVAQVRARSEETNIYEAAIRGELAKVQVYEAQVRAFAEQVNAARVEADIRFKNADVDIKENELRLEKYRADIQRYEADITKEVSRIRELANTYGVDQQSYKALLDGWEAWERIGVQNKDIFINTLVEDTKLEQNKAQIELQALVSAANVRLTAAGAGVKMYENIAAGAESSLNSLVSLAQESV